MLEQSASNRGCSKFLQLILLILVFVTGDSNGSISCEFEVLFTAKAIPFVPSFRCTESITQESEPLFIKIALPEVTFFMSLYKLTSF